jgi:hypothetical protein
MILSCDSCLRVSLSLCKRIEKQEPFFHLFFLSEFCFVTSG